MKCKENLDVGKYLHQILWLNMNTQGQGRSINQIMVALLPPSLLTSTVFLPLSIGHCNFNNDHSSSYNF